MRRSFPFHDVWHFFKLMLTKFVVFFFRTLSLQLQSKYIYICTYIYMRQARYCSSFGRLSYATGWAGAGLLLLGFCTHSDISMYECTTRKSPILRFIVEQMFLTRSSSICIINAIFQCNETCTTLTCSTAITQFTA